MDQSKLKKIKIKILRFLDGQKEFMYQKIDVLFVTSKIENCPLSVIEARVMEYLQLQFQKVELKK